MRGRRKTTRWAGLAVSSLAMGGLSGSRLGREFPVPAAAATISAPVAEAPAQRGLPEPPAAPAPLPQEEIPASCCRTAAGRGACSLAVAVQRRLRPVRRSERTFRPIAGDGGRVRNPSLEAAAAAWRGRRAISSGDRVRQPDVWLRAESRRSGAGGQWRLDGRGVAEDPVVRQTDAARQRRGIGGGGCREANVGDARLMLDEAAKTALADYYAAVREAEVNPRRSPC